MEEGLDFPLFGGALSVSHMQNSTDLEEAILREDRAKER